MAARQVLLDELRIPAVRGQQLLMTAAATDAAAFQHQDLIGTAHQHRVV